MVHNGIEYGMMQALAEGFALLAAREDFGFDGARLAETWRHGSVIRSWLLDLCADALFHEGALEAAAPVIADSGEGRWAALEALMARFSSQGGADYASRLLALMRAGFGGHPVAKR
jgi:6-phosphogluconate dehydrogenase